MSEIHPLYPHQPLEINPLSDPLTSASPDINVLSEEEDLEQWFSMLEDSLEEESGENSPESLDNSPESPESPPEIATDWFDLACKLKKQNQELIQTVVSLEQALAQAKYDIQEQQRRSREKEVIYTDHPEMFATEGQNSLLKLQMEGVNAEIQELKEQMAQLERECAILKEESQDKTHQLTTAERHIRELHTRLQRQQRYTLQYKAALEQYLGQPIEEPLETPSDGASQRLPIQPWSGQTVPLESSNEPEPSETPLESDSPLPSPSFRVNLSKVAHQYGSQTPTKPLAPQETIDLPAFLRRRSS